MQTAVIVAVGAVRVWTRIYTCGMSDAAAADRRGEIESDLWELLHDPDVADGVPVAAHIVIRLWLGIPDDIQWRLAQVRVEDNLALRRTIAFALAVTVLLSIGWVAPLIGARDGAATAVTDCANRMRPADTTAELRYQVIRCSAAFFRRGAQRPD